jgi:hypothetical protein
MSSEKDVDTKPRGHKAPLQIIPYRGLLGAAIGLEDGMVKYKLDNWKGETPDYVDAYVGAAQRHLWALQDKDLFDYAQYTLVHHASHAASGLIIALFHEGVGYEHPKDAMKPQGSPAGFHSCPPNILKGFTPRLDLLPLKPLEAIAGELEREFYHNSYGDQRLVLATALNALCVYYSERSAGALKTAAACCFMLVPGDEEFQPSSNVVAYYQICGLAGYEDMPTDPEAKERMAAVIERDKNANLQLQVSEEPLPGSPDCASLR